MNAEVTTSDKRGTKRRRALKDGRILLAGSRVTYDCAIRDFTEKGVRLRLASDSVLLPPRFELMFVAEGVAYPVEKRWHTGNEYGVAVVGPSRPVTARIS